MRTDSYFDEHKGVYTRLSKLLGIDYFGQFEPITGRFDLV